jgi:predicted enzyme related to lactoylglutathione lyase
VAWNTVVSVASADDAAERVRDAAGVVLAEPVDAPPAGRLAVCADPAGATFCVWEPRARQGAQLVNQAGTWAMSALSTPDPEAATAFYSAVFGWQTGPFGTDVTLWQMPGYVGGTPEQPVPRDVVAVMVPAGDGMAPNWNVDFWVEDVDATAGRAAALGAEIIAEPHEFPGFRQAVLRDPQGAAFSVSRVTI